MINCFIRKLGIVTSAAKEAGICRENHYHWMKIPEYKKAVESINEICIDFVEGKLYKLIDDGNPNVTMFYMKTKGKNRGYRETIENINHNYNSDWTASVIEAHEKREKIVEGVVESKEEVIVDEPIGIDNIKKTNDFKKLSTPSRTPLIAVKSSIKINPCLPIKSTASTKSL